jgi:hypothetical protein
MSDIGVGKSDRSQVAAAAVRGFHDRWCLAREREIFAPAADLESAHIARLEVEVKLFESLELLIQSLACSAELDLGDAASRLDSHPTPPTTPNPKASGTVANIDCHLNNADDDNADDDNRDATDFCHILDQDISILVSVMDLAHSIIASRNDSDQRCSPTQLNL